MDIRVVFGLFWADCSVVVDVRQGLAMKDTWLGVKYIVEREGGTVPENYEADAYKIGGVISVVACMPYNRTLSV